MGTQADAMAAAPGFPRTSRLEPFERPPGGAWTKLCAPEILFLLGVLQGLAPYVLWWFTGPNPDYSYDVTYLPVLLWGIGYGFFFLGARGVRRLPPVTGPEVEDKGSRLEWITAVTLAVCVIQIFFFLRLLGGIPLLNYLYDKISIWEVNELERDSFSGQGGLLMMTLFVINGLILLLVKKNLRRPRPVLAVLIVLAFAVVFLGTTCAGRRQGLFITIAFLVCGFCITWGDPVQPFLKALGLRWGRARSYAVGILLLVGLVLSFGIIGSVRRGESPFELQWYGTDQAVTYLQLPLINLEAQCEEAGLGPGEFDALAPFIWFLPAKLVDSLVGFGSLPPRAEPTASAGFFGEIHWSFGVWGVALMAFLIGRLSRYFHRRAPSSPFHLLVYCQIAWTLVAAHSYNHFLRLVFLPGPAVLFLIVTLAAGLALRRPIRAEPAHPR